MPWHENSTRWTETEEDKQRKLAKGSRCLLSSLIAEALIISPVPHETVRYAVPEIILITTEYYYYYFFFQMREPSYLDFIFAKRSDFVFLIAWITEM